jgi:hypothetical protein
MSASTQLSPHSVYLILSTSQVHVSGRPHNACKHSSAPPPASSSSDKLCRCHSPGARDGLGESP